MQFVSAHFRIEKPVFHVSINPHPDDCLTDDQLADIGREYMHIVSLRVDSMERKLLTSKNMNAVRR